MIGTIIRKVLNNIFKYLEFINSALVENSLELNIQMEFNIP